MRRSNRSVALGALVILAAIGFLIYQSISTNLVYYITPSELLAKGASAYGQSLRLGGQVRPGSVRWNSHDQTLRFEVQDPKAVIWVLSHGLPPSLFRPGAGVVVEGSYAAGSFIATNLMIKHGSTYRAPPPGSTPVPDNYINNGSG